MSEKYRNPEAPPGYVKKRPILRLENNIIDGVYCQFLPFIIKSGLIEAEDVRKFSAFAIQSSEDEDVREVPHEVSVVKESQVNNEVLSYENKESSASDQIEQPKSSRKFTDSSVFNETKKLKRKSVVDYSSDDSSSSGDSKQKSKKMYCPPPLPEMGKETPEHIYGYYPCEVCNLTLNSYVTYQTHMSGKKHLKAVKARDVASTALKAINPLEIKNRYPQAPLGVYRKKIKDISFIQDTVENSLKSPCPGLEHVTEIRGFKETSYYCHLCDAPCSVNSILSHLKGYKHLLQCLRLFKPSMYRRVENEPKWRVEREIIYLLKTVQSREGIGKIVVERDYVDKEIPRHVRDSSSSRSMDMPSTSYHDPTLPFTDYYNLTTIPDTSKSDYYCKICDAHMNNIEMWESHIRGKRHLTNIKKNPGAAPSKVKSVPKPQTRAFLMDRLRNVDDPVVGLDNIREVQNTETNNEMYQCFLCGGCLTAINVVEHLTSQKHRTKYLEQIKHESMETLKNMNLKENSAYYLIEEICYEVEKEYGPGCPEVFVSKG